MSYFSPALQRRADELVSLYPRKQSAAIPLLHLAQEQEGYLSDEGIAAVAALTETTPAEVRGTASFYEMFHLEPIGTYKVSICTNIACLLAGGEEMLEHASKKLGCSVGGTSADGLFTLEEAECLADCDKAPCVQVNHRYVRTTTESAFDDMIERLKSGKLAKEIPPHGTLVRVPRARGLVVSKEEINRQRAEAKAARETRAATEAK
jgi:NADH-quinone oxidoreductase subunit E